MLPVLVCIGGDYFYVRFYFCYFAVDSLFSFAEDSLFFFANWFRQRAGLCPCTPQALKSLTKLLTGFVTIQLKLFVKNLNLLALNPLKHIKLQENKIITKKTIDLIGVIGYNIRAIKHIILVCLK